MTAVPVWEQFVAPSLRFLSDGKTYPAREIREAAGDRLDISDEARHERSRRVSSATRTGPAGPSRISTEPGPPNAPCGAATRSPLSAASSSPSTPTASPNNTLGLSRVYVQGKRYALDPSVALRSRPSSEPSTKSRSSARCRSSRSTRASSSSRGVGPDCSRGPQC